MQLNNFNPFSSHFLKFTKDDRKKIEEIGQNSVGSGMNDKAIIGDILLNIDPGGIYDSTGISFNSYFDTKSKRIQCYRQMANYPEISSAIHMICDEAINENNVGDFVTFEIKDTEGLKRKTIRDLRDEWDIIINELFNFRETGWDLFKCFMIDAELYFEVVLSEDKKDIIAFKQLPAFTMTPVYKNGEIIKYIQQAEDSDPIVFEKNQILYVNYGEFGDDKTDVRGYLDPGIYTYNIVRNLEESAAIAQMVRGPERRIFNIEVGKVPKSKQEQILREFAANYRKNLRFDPTTGLLSAGERFQAMSEDFFFARSDGQGSSVETLQSSQNFEQLIELPNYFLRKLYKSLHIPSTRWSGGVLAGMSDNGHGQYSNKMEIEREEINFTKFISRISRRFCKLFYQAFIMDLTLKEFDPKLLVPFNYSIEMVSNNKYNEYREMELTKEQLDILSQYSELRMSAENPNGIFAEEYFLKNICGFTQSQLEVNEDMKKEQKDQETVSSEDSEVMFGDETMGTPMGRGGSDFGGDFGSSEGSSEPLGGGLEMPSAPSGPEGPETGTEPAEPAI